MASHRKSRPAGIRTSGPATTTPTSVGVLSPSAEASPSADDGRPSAEEIERKIDDLYRRGAQSATSKYENPEKHGNPEKYESYDAPGETYAAVKERSGRPRGRAAAPETAAGTLADLPQDYFDPARLMGRLTAHQAVRKRQEAAVRSPEAAVRGPEVPAGSREHREREQRERYEQEREQDGLKEAKVAVQLKLAAARVLLSERLAARQSAPSGSAAVTSYATRAETAVAFARAQIGKPYVWGAAGPGSYDGPGLAQAAWKTAGVSLPRTTRPQAEAGTLVSLADVRPGDLIFFYDEITHVGMYVGDGVMVHAPAPGTLVREESVHHGGASIINRVVRPA